MNIEDLQVDFIYRCMIDKKSNSVKLGIFKYYANKTGPHRDPIFGELHQKLMPLKHNAVFCVKKEDVLEELSLATDADRWKDV